MDKDILMHTFGFSILLIVTLTLATKFGIIHCSMIPMWCEGYKTIMSTFLQRNYPAILILHGEEGLGDPNALYRYFLNDCRVYVEKKNIHTVRRGNLERFDYIIVTRAKKMTADEFDMLWDFVSSGGKIVFIGDAGTESPAEDIVTYEDLGDKNKEGAVNVWDRKLKDGTIISFGTDLLGLEYVSNRCSECNDYAYLGNFVVEEQDPLTKGIPKKIPLHSNYTIVRPTGGSVFGPQTVIATIRETAGVKGVKPPFPAIILVSKRVIYYAFPPEYMLRKEQIQDTAQAGFIMRNLCEWIKEG